MYRDKVNPAFQAETNSFAVEAYEEIENVYRGIISFKLGGTEFDLVPSLENLDNLETATSRNR